MILLSIKVYGILWLKNILKSSTLTENIVFNVSAYHDDRTNIIEANGKKWVVESNRFRQGFTEFRALK